MKLKNLLTFMLLYTIAWGVWGAPVTLSPDAPQRHVVVRGDTLWEIAGRFLRDPWRWPDIWQVNQQVKNPHLIYPGDIIALSYRDNGDPVLELQRGLSTYKVSPTVRVIELEKAIPTIPIDVIQQFLLNPQVVNKETLENAPYVVAGTEERLILGAGDEAYVRGLGNSATTRYGIYRGGEVYRDPDNPSKVLGYEALFIADAKVRQFGDPAILSIQNSKREILVGDRLLPRNDQAFEQHFFPHVSPTPIEGKIITVIEGVSQIGQHQAVVLNLGTEDGMDKGTVLAIYQAGRVVRDPISRLPDDKVQLPDERAGVLMVFRAFNHISYGLVMGAERAIHVDDVVRNP
ncbi:LysM peptidoglycan-binding domain-containing protein [Nitrosococcus wardiae]|uniref:LysM domain-containing protein n=1 Tax=Nitrosococcus wardiae TaxID=1814290 RepID=A0A4P7BX23_9GAMM|nr:LysM domain-containing protein [Nitrosococcus wardiae]QBQ53674.1 LysM domain-containing protein [Nitrosococcus wardiae]